MTVAARSAKKRTVSATPSEVPSGSYPYATDQTIVTGWHRHEQHQLEYAAEGVAEVETESTRYLLPPQQAVWIPAGTNHCTTLTRVRTVSIFLDPSVEVDAGEHVRVIAVQPVLREMILYSQRWPLQREPGDERADRYFETLAGVIGEALEHELPLRLPTSHDPLVHEIMRFTREHLADVTEGSLCRAVGTSERTLRRTFLAETGMTWRNYLLRSRVLAAMAMLAEPTSAVVDVATAVGFGSASGFGRAFRRVIGQTPVQYRRSISHS